MGVFRHQTFDAVDRERMTGMPAVNYRDLKRRGFFEAAGTGWNRHPLHSIAGGLVFETLRKLGVPPAVAKPIVARSAMVVMLYAYEEPGAVVDQDGIQFGERPVQHSTEILKRFLVATSDDLYLCDSAGDFFGSGADESGKGAALFVDLRRLGRELAVKAARPLAIFENKDLNQRGVEVY